jgi:hypothetical protein
LKFIRAIYRDFSVKIRTKFGLTENIPVMRGLRQGCPASPLLFNIFINDIFDMARAVELGVKVPGVADLLIGLLFADDTTLFSESCEDLAISLHCINRWCEKNGMIINGNKSGVMAFGKDAQADLINVPGGIRCGDQIIPIVERYKYLGLWFESSGNIAGLKRMLSRMAKERAKSGWKAFFKIAPTLRAQYIPMLVRVNLIKAVLIPCLVWGGELWALGRTRCAEHQSIVNSAVKVRRFVCA